MASLVADYGASSGSESDAESPPSDSDNAYKDTEYGWKDAKESEDEGCDVSPSKSTSDKLPLPTPDFNGAPTLRTSVFSNPFVEAEKAKSAILEKHVKMTPTLDDTKMINGRKICWNYRKGRCRFGHNCTFAHDSDLHKSRGELEAVRSPRETLLCQNQCNGAIANDDEEIDQENERANKRKKRPGLSQGLVPGKKVLKMYKKQQGRTIERS